MEMGDEIFKNLQLGASYYSMPKSKMTMPATQDSHPCYKQQCKFKTGKQLHCIIQSLQKCSNSSMHYRCKLNDKKGWILKFPCLCIMSNWLYENLIDGMRTNHWQKSMPCLAFLSSIPLFSLSLFVVSLLGFEVGWKEI